MEQTYRLSWSAMQAFMTCPRKHNLTYIQNLQKKPTAEKAKLLLGSAFHEGIETALKMAAKGKHTLPDYQELAVAAARKYLADNIPLGLTTRNEKGQTVRDDSYYNAVADVRHSVAELLRYHLKVMGFGSHFHDRFIVPRVQDLIAGGVPRSPSEGFTVGPLGEPTVEYRFEYVLDRNVVLSGYVDAILWDIELGQYVVYDWKTRGSFPYDQYAEIDGQLHLYAAVLNELFPNANICEVRMYQMLTTPPQPASISRKNHLPNTGAASYNTTWEVWCATLPKGLNPAHYEDVIREKLKTDEAFYRVISVPVTEHSSHEAIDNALLISKLIVPHYAEGYIPTAVLSSNACKFCDFAILCSGVLRYGGDPSSVLTEHYIPRKIEGIEEDTPED